MSPVVKHEHRIERVIGDFVHQMGRLTNRGVVAVTLDDQTFLSVLAEMGEKVRVTHSGAYGYIHAVKYPTQWGEIEIRRAT